MVKQIKKDAQFLASCGIIDYSMIVFKVDRTAEFRDRYIMDVSDQPGEQLKQLKSEKLNGGRKIFWHIGIIDYFQLWNTSKRLEQIYKKFKEQNLSLDTSSQPTEKYKKRFVDLFDEIIQFERTLSEQDGF